MELVPAFRIASLVLLPTTGHGGLSFGSGDLSLSLELAPFFQGPPGTPGGAASISADDGNTATIGEDGGVYVPEFQWTTVQW